MYLLGFFINGKNNCIFRNFKEIMLFIKRKKPLAREIKRGKELLREGREMKQNYKQPSTLVDSCWIDRPT